MHGAKNLDPPDTLRKSAAMAESSRALHHPLQAAEAEIARLKGREAVDKLHVDGATWRTRPLLGVLHSPALVPPGALSPEVLHRVEESCLV